MPTYETRHGRIQLEREGEGRFEAFIVPTGQPARLRIGLVLGGARLWQAELVGRSVPIRASTRRALARAMAEWAAAQPGFVLLRRLAKPAVAPSETRA